MNFDALTTAAICTELSSTLRDARVETIIQPTDYSIAVEFWFGRSSWLYLSAHPQLSRVHLVTAKPTKLHTEPPAFVMLLRKYLEGGRLRSVVQPVGERMLRLDFEKRAEGTSLQSVLIIEAMGRFSNILLCRPDNLILGCLKLVGPEVNRYRVMLPNHSYLPPPPQTRPLRDQGNRASRLDPLTISTAELRIASVDAMVQSPDEAAKGSPKLAWQIQMSILLGWSALAAKEQVYRATGRSDTPAAPDLPWELLARQARSIAGLGLADGWQPRLVKKGSQVIAYAVYPLEQYAELEQQLVASPSKMLETFYLASEWQSALEGAKAPVRQALHQHAERTRKKRAILQAELVAIEQAPAWRQKGELLLAYQSEVAPHVACYTAPGFQEDDQPVVIELDPQLTVVDNANRYFKQYHKMRRAGEQLPIQLEQARLNLAQIEQLNADLLLAETVPEISEVRQSVETAGYLQGKQKKDKLDKRSRKAQKSKGPRPAPPLSFTSVDGYTIYVGKNSRQNEEVTFQLSRSGSDIWLHARTIPGSHVLILSQGKPIPASTIAQAARLAAYYSQARSSTRVPIDYTEQRSVRKIKGAGPGMVTYRQERTLSIEPGNFT